MGKRLGIKSLKSERDKLRSLHREGRACHKKLESRGETRVFVANTHLCLFPPTPISRLGVLFISATFKPNYAELFFFSFRCSPVSLHCRVLLLPPFRIKYRKSTFLQCWIVFSKLGSVFEKAVFGFWFSNNRLRLRFRFFKNFFYIIWIWLFFDEYVLIISCLY